MWVLLGCGLIDCLLTQGAAGKETQRQRKKENVPPSVSVFSPGSHQEP